MRFLPLRALPFLLAILAPTLLSAQTGTVTGRVVDSASGAPLPRATVRLLDSVSTTPRGAIGGADGSFVIRGVPPGSYRLVVSYAGYAQLERPNVVVRAEGTTQLGDLILHHSFTRRPGIVVSASRRPQKETEAPASVTVIDARQIATQPALTEVDHLRTVPGLDIVQNGLTQNTVVARGFNNAFSGSLTVLTDYRIASVPSLRFNAYNFIPLVSQDIEQIEVVRGPGSALYGPNAANGVLHTLTRSPFASTGTWFSLAGGERDIVQAQARHAGTIGDRIGYKLSAQYMRGTDWSTVDSTEIQARADFLADTANAGVNPDTLKIGARDSAIERVAAELRVDWIPTDDLTLMLNAGVNDAIRNPEITGVGGAQSRDWLSSYVQVRALWKEFFVQAFYNRSDAGGSYLLRTGQPVVDRSGQFVAQAQHSTTIGEPLKLTYGLDYLLTMPETEGTITGGNENDDDITEVGGYVQGEYAILPDRLEATGALRVDHHSRIDEPIISPRAAIVWHPLENQTLRLTWNRAYSSPTTNDLFLDILVQQTPLFAVRASGVPEGGFHFRQGAADETLMRSSLFSDPSTFLPLDSARGATIWRGVQNLVNAELRKNGLTQTIDSIAPPPASVGLELRSLNQETAGFDPSSAPEDVPAIRPTITSTYEFGWEGTLFDRIRIAVDLYRSDYKDFVASLEAITPNVFYQQEPLRQHLLSEVLRTGLAADTATAEFYATYLAQQIAGVPGDPSTTGVPLGTVTPENANDPTAIIFSSRNYGNITVYGWDISVQGAITNELGASVSASFLDRNLLHNLDGHGDLALNAPRFKISGGLEYRNDELGLDAGVRVRHVDGFPVRSGVYVGDVPGYTVTDLTVGGRLSFAPGLAAHLSVQNLLTFVEGSSESPFSARHIEFIGAPALGRLALLRLTYELGAGETNR